MKKKIYYFIVVSMLLFGINISAFAASKVEINNSNFPDNRLRQYLLTYYDDNEDGFLTKSEIKQITRLGKKVNDTMGTSNGSVGAFYVNDLTGVEYLTYLQKINVFGLKGMDVDLSHNKKLEYIRIVGDPKQDCYINSLKLEKLTKLKELYVNDNRLKELNIKKCTALTVVNVSSNQLSTLDISKNKKITRLDCHDNEISKMIISTNVSRIDYLDISGNEFQKTFPLKYFKSITELYMHDGEKMKTIDTASTKKLLTLECGGQLLTSVKVSKSTLLRDLKITDSPMLTALNLAKNKKLRNLSLDNVGITDLSVSDLEELAVVNCKNIDSLNISKYKGDVLDLQGSEIQTLIIERMMDFGDISLTNSKKSFVNVKGNWKNCRIRNIVFRFLPYLKEIDVSNTSIETISCSKVDSLKKVVCDTGVVISLPELTDYTIQGNDTISTENYIYKIAVKGKNATITISKSEM